MKYTIKNLRDVEDHAAKQGFSEAQEARFAHRDLEAADTGVSFQIVKPGKRHPFGHHHKKAEEVYVVLSGSGRVKLDDEVVPVGSMDAIRISPPVKRGFEAGPEGLELLVFGPRHEGDAQIVRDFWEE